MIDSLTRNSDIAPYLFRKLSSGSWILIDGDLEAISILEGMVYEPGTVFNADFEAFIGTNHVLFLGFKNERLRAALHLVPGQFWNDLFSISCVKSEKYVGRIDIHANHFNKGVDKVSLIESLVQEIIETMEGA